MTASDAVPLPPPSAIARWLLPAIALAGHLLTARGYGYFRDELYYLANAEHLGLGYVDHPPLIGWIAAAVRATLGDSLLAIRFLPALAAAVTIALAAAIGRELGGGRYAQALAAVATLLAPLYLGLFGILTMNAFDIVTWAACLWIAARALRSGEHHWWLAFGAVAGLGLENKISVLFLGFGLAAGLLAARRWDALRSPWLWAGSGLALLMFLPHLVWQQIHGWPTLEFMANARAYKIAAIPPLDFVLQQVLGAGPLALPLWSGGLVFLLADRRARPFRTLGWAYLAILAVLIVGRSKPYYLAPAYVALFAAGGAALDGWTTRWRTRRGAALVRITVPALVVAGGLATAPLAKALLPVSSFVRYAAAVGVAPGTDENHELGRLPQFFADMHGWPELAQTVAAVHRDLPPAEREHACVFAQNYGEAGAIDLFGPALGLPKAISGHNSYWLWGPRGCTGELVIVIGGDRDDLVAGFEEVEDAGFFDCADCMPYEDEQTIYVARRSRLAIDEIWPQVKHYD